MSERAMMRYDCSSGRHSYADRGERGTDCPICGEFAVCIGRAPRLYQVSVIGAERYSSTFSGMTAGEARYKALLALRDVWPDITLIELRTYSLGTLQPTRELLSDMREARS